MHIQRISASGACRKIIRTAVFAAALFLSAGLSYAETLKIGILKNDYFKGTDELRPFADFIMHSGKYSGYKIVETDSPQETADALTKGRINMALLSIYPSAIIHRNHQNIPDMVVTANNSLYVKSCIFVLKESPVKWISDLKNKTVAFSSSYSTGGYYLSYSHMRKMLYGAPFASLFAESWDDVFTQVFLKKADAGATQYTDYENVLPPLYKSTFRTIAETESVPGLFLYIRNDKNKSFLIRSCLVFGNEEKNRESVIDSLSLIDFDWKNLFKSLPVP
ncbi:PhnD/SsuA/transferrin family substrate-binding protein [Seleniivibrio sp.]|uniref:phosphate/phosphite/phosphonate ABC transporter substrate-binding protein n=1 Tax=Seleniivibrio sp. TaxID=2898801 RepID=UPI0025DAD367|nr:PhnD/SsuA/transferrin family substrate-binding protein [Seleniivibrio sp.]MCD8554813.1 phosphate/phosphite/phosphonate ABC transporter substrate-binding protein [Seleniivibrio sp.]